MTKRLLLVPLAALSLAAVPRNPAPAAADDLLARSEKMYAALKSYADTGTILYEYGATSVSRHSFKTYYRAPRHFYFEFNEDKADGGNRLVLWGEGQDFQLWSTDAATHNIYPKGQGRAAFVGASYATLNSASLMASLLFPAAGLVSLLGEMGETAPAGSETVSGRPAQKLTAVAQATYGTGYVHNVRRAAVWIDPDTLLIRKLFEDTPKGYQAGMRRRVTVTFEPQANPPLDDSKFKFTPPSAQK